MDNFCVKVKMRKYEREDDTCSTGEKRETKAFAKMF